jgi:hypothetical protein
VLILYCILYERIDSLYMSWFLSASGIISDARQCGRMGLHYCSSLALFGPLTVSSLPVDDSSFCTHIRVRVRVHVRCYYLHCTGQTPSSITQWKPKSHWNA